MNDVLRCAVLMVDRHRAKMDFRIALWVGRLIYVGNLDGALAMASRSRHRGQMRRISIPLVRFKLYPGHPRRFLPILRGRPHDPRQDLAMVSGPGISGMRTKYVSSQSRRQMR